MKRFFSAVGVFLRSADIPLLIMCICATVFGIVTISSAAAYQGAAHYVLIQSAALVIGVIGFIILTLIDIDIIAERWDLLLIFSVLFLGSLYFFGVQGNSGNKSWLRPSFLPFGLQPAEICKVFYVIILAKLLSRSERNVNSIWSVGRAALVTLVLMGEIMVISGDDGSALAYAAIFVIMMLCAGVNFAWFGLGAAALAVAIPYAWQSGLIDSYQKARLMLPYDATIDPTGQTERYQMRLSQIYIGGGQLTGQGLYAGNQTQAGTLPEQHTDFIFSVIGEELGMIGCIACMLLLLAIIIRCFYVGYKANSYMNRLICVGMGGMLLFQVCINIGMCLGVLPIIGLTLPFFSYGGSSIVTMFAAVGVVSGIHMRPAPDSSAHYLRPPIQTRLV